MFNEIVPTFAQIIEPMRSFLLSLVLLTLAVLCSRADSISVSGNVSGEWDVDTVLVTGDIIVGEGDSLFIQPGVLVEFQGPYSFYVGGYVRALGTIADQIFFDVADTTGFSNDTIPDGGWNGMQFYYTHQSVDSSIFEHCTFRHGKAVSADTLENHGGAFCIRYFDKVRISHCTFLKNFAALNGGAVYLDESDIIMKDNWFVLNNCGPVVFPWGYGGAVCSDSSDPLIMNNVFDANTSTGVGGAVAIRFRDSRVYNNIFSANHSGLGGAVGYLHYYEFPHSQCNNLMYGNSSEFFGGAVACIDAGPTFVNNTLTDNASIYGGAFYVKDSIVPDVYNSILWGNSAGVGPEVYLWDAYASANFFYCDVAGGPELFGGSGGGSGYTGTYVNNLDLDPLFEDAQNGDYHLSPSSLLLNAGSPDTTDLGLPSTDLDGMPRVDVHAQRIDMGCYESQWVGIRPVSNHESGTITVFPNPASGQLTIESAIVIQEIQLIDIHGKTVMVKYPEVSKMVIQTGNLGPGVYVMRVYSGSEVVAGRIVINK